jgi:hypothetical protein
VLVLGVLSTASAVLGGLPFLWFHHGAEFLPIGLLDTTPFATFLIPGVLLTFVVGGTSLFATMAVARRWDTRVDLTILAGGTLALWIVVEMALLRGVYWLHVLYGLLGVALLALGIRAALASRIPRHRWVVFVTVCGAVGFVGIAVAGVFGEFRVGSRRGDRGATSGGPRAVDRAATPRRSREEVDRVERTRVGDRVSLVVDPGGVGRRDHAARRAPRRVAVCWPAHGLRPGARELAGCATSGRATGGFACAPGMMGAMNVRVSALFVLSVACAHRAPAPPESAPSTPTVSPPVTLEEFRAAFPVGTTILMRYREIDAAPFEERWNWTAADDEGCTIAALSCDEEGRVVRDEGAGTATWVDLMSHATFPADRTTRSDASIEVPAGRFDTWLYVVRDEAADGSPEVASYHFDRHLPGPPVLLTVEQDGVEVRRMELVEREVSPPPPGSRCTL